MTERITVDGNEAAARVAHLANEVIAIYPITPASPMGELADQWSAQGKRNLWGAVPQVIEMQSEGGAAGAMHGALTTGALTTSFTASQGLLLMLPNMYKIAGELTPAVLHIAARTLATHALSIFGDHSDVMSARSTGWAMICANDVQEAQDIAAIAHSATLRSRVPFLHFFDGFRTSHELTQIHPLSDDDLRAMLPDELIAAHRGRALDPDRPMLRGSAQNPDVFFQAREAIQPFYDALSDIVVETMEQFAKLTGRSYAPFEYVGAPNAERVLVLMGSGVGAAEEAVARLRDRGERVGLLKVRLYRPFDAARMVAALPASAHSIVVLDRCKEPGALGEPLYMDVVTALAAHAEGKAMPKVIGGRYGVGQKEFTPAMAAAALAELNAAKPRHSFTVGIVDDVSHSSLSYDDAAFPEPADLKSAIFIGLGSDGTVGATKSTAKILAEETGLWTQGYFVYDSKKSGSITVSHLRFGQRPIHSTYQIRQSHFVACHQFNFLERIDVLDYAAPGATFLLNSPYPAETVWEALPREVQEQIQGKELRLFVIDADSVAEQSGLGRRINTIMQTCFFYLSDLVPREEAIAAIKRSIDKTYGRAGQLVLERNHAGVEAAIGALHEVQTARRDCNGARRVPLLAEGAPDFVQRVTRLMMEGKGDLLPVSAMPVDGGFPTGTTRFEKRSIAREIPIWDADICIQCGLCALVCPHAAIRSAAQPEALFADTLIWRPGRGKDLAGQHLTIQVAPDDCTGCGVCVDVCPAFSKANVSHKAINMLPKHEHLDVERERFAAFLQLPEPDRSQVAVDSIKGSQLLTPRFEFSGACAGCGETPYLKLLSQLFGDRAVIANATGCSSIYGGNLPTTPWTKGPDGRGPAWSNSLFEDNAEFGLGMRLALDHREQMARHLVGELRKELGEELAQTLQSPCPKDETSFARRQAEIVIAREKLRAAKSPAARSLEQVIETLLPRSVWIVGGDGWAYDIGFGGLDHVLASGRNVNLLVLDTEVYSNTGGQASKATPLGAVAKFASGGKAIGKKDLGMIASAYGNVYVAQIAIGANPAQTLRAFHEAESYDGPSLIIAYSTCIAHGIDMTKSMSHQKDAVQSGYWPLYRFDPRSITKNEAPLRLDSRKPKIKFTEFARQEARFAMLERSDPEAAKLLHAKAQDQIDERWRVYEQMARIEHGEPQPEEV